MKALKYISYSLAGLSVLFALINIIDWVVNSNIITASIATSLLYIAWDTAVIVLMLIYVFAQKRAMGYIAVGMMLTTLTISFTQSLISQLQQVQYVGVLPIMLWVLTESLTFAFWVLWLFAPRSKPMAITVFVLAIVIILFAALDMVQWIGLVVLGNLSFVLNCAERICYFLSLAIAAWWLVLRGKKSLSAGGEEVICEGVE
ncbi:MAG: hypothetical protein E7316_03890 [Clostridiales bacterium]|nr:hypothetical protein [Clostridiales bacterium]